MTQQITDTAGFARAGPGWGQDKGTFRKCFPSPPYRNWRKENTTSGVQETKQGLKM
jgi:hypothetical protein